MTGDQSGAIAFAVIAAFFLLRFWQAREYGWTRFQGLSWFPREVYRKDNATEFGVAQAFNLVAGLACGAMAVFLAVR
jgi:hypothetical protein